MDKRNLPGGWLLNENSGDEVHNSGGYVNTGTITGTPDWGLNSFETTLRHDDNQYITFAKKATGYITDNFTVLWIGSPVQLAPAIRTFFVGQYQSDGPGYDWGFYISAAYWPYFFVRNVGGVGLNVGDTVALNVGQVYCLVGRYDGINISIWVDGIKKGQNAQTGNVQGNFPFKLGHKYSTDYYSDIKTNVLYFFDHALPDPEILRLYSRPFYRFDRPARPLYHVAAGPPAITPLFMDLGTMYWTVKKTSGLYTRM